MNLSRGRTSITLAFVLTACLPFLAGCGDEATKVEVVSPEPKKTFDPDALPLEDPSLIEGRRIWKEHCSYCHLTGRNDAPKIGDKEVWAPRIAQGEAILFEHAINGFMGPKMTEMPPRGGSKDLSDEQVQMAVKFVVEASK